MVYVFLKVPFWGLALKGHQRGDRIFWTLRLGSGFPKLRLLPTQTAGDTQ